MKVNIKQKNFFFNPTSNNSVSFICTFVLKYTVYLQF